MTYANHTVPMRVCPTCSGKGVNPVMPMLLCPKCKGEKFLPVQIYRSSRALPSDSLERGSGKMEPSKKRASSA